MTDYRWLTAIAFGVACVAGVASAATFDAQAAKKTCVERYNREKDAGTIPAGMAKTKYVNQCFLSMRHSAELEKELAAAEGGSNELVAMPPAVQPKADKGTSSKPAAVVTPPPPKGY